MIKSRYRNTGFCRQLFFYWRGKSMGIEFNRHYFRYYRVTPVAAMPRYREIRR